jgi:hypothetical protein
MRTRRGPEVNLLAPRRRLPVPGPGWRKEAGLALVAVAVWGVAALAIAMLLGWVR